MNAGRDIWAYIQSQLKLGGQNWKEIRDAIKDRRQIVTISSTFLSPSLLPITIEKLDQLHEHHHNKYRFVFPQTPVNLSSEYKNIFITINATIVGMSAQKPFPVSYTVTCPKCGGQWHEITYNPIFPIDNSDIRCMSMQCRDELHLKYAIDEEFVNGIEVHFEHAMQRFIAFVIAKPLAGFLEVQNKLMHAFKYKYPVRLHGIEIIKRFGSSYQYFFQIIDVDFIIMGHDQPAKMLPFYITTEPTNEKEAVFSIFFANIAYMQAYLNFSSYTIQKSYPDLSIVNEFGTRYIEFEYDAANFWKHGHDTQNPPCDLIIAWKNTTKRADIPILLLSNLHNTYVADRAAKIIDENEMRTMIKQFIEFTSQLFQLTQNDTFPLFILPFLAYRPLSTLIPLKKIIIHVKNGTKEDEKNWMTFSKLFSKDISPFIVVFRDTVKETDADAILSMTLQRNVHTTKLTTIESILPFQQCLHRLDLLGKSLPSLPVEKELYGFAMEKCNDLEMVNILVMLSGIVSAFLGRIAIMKDDFIFMQQLLAAN